MIFFIHLYKLLLHILQSYIFLLPSPINLPNHNNVHGLFAVNVNILGVNYSLYTYVHQHYGLNDAFSRSIPLALPEKIRPGQGFPHPCLNPGFNASIDLGSAQDPVRLTGG